MFLKPYDTNILVFIIKLSYMYYLSSYRHKLTCLSKLHNTWPSSSTILFSMFSMLSFSC